MFYHYIYLSRLIQKAEIEVDEKGTVPVDAPGISQQNKPAPPVFKANKPFLYFIVDKLTSSIIFAGKNCQSKYSGLNKKSNDFRTPGFNVTSHSADRCLPSHTLE
ncbi:hypothetical protein NQ318_008022 [Aromia moschata]|uniref:Serpin domain-containing protein n=1 Tax=Aromia moschata TaxID=1265417 RepID=A0AAV8XJB3_9CUCU|nr:hypothetical protein NQ318_008022 [Aromia moschata]